MEKTICRTVIILVVLQNLLLSSCCSLRIFDRTTYLRSAEDRQQADAVKALLERLVPSRSNDFVIDVRSSLGNKDTFKIESRNGKIGITGNRGYTAALGIQYYLKYYCGAHISWSGNQLQLPAVLPKPISAKSIMLNDKYRYYMNVCTMSYSTVWWNWTRWEKEIDWMALNGINLPLAFTGQESIWRKVFKTFNFTDHDINEFFTGPAFLAWNRMGNVQAWAGPLSDSWLSQKKKLQHQILKRMRTFGMIPVLPAFSGRVPPSTPRIFPNASVTYLGGNWGHFSEPYGPVTFLEPTDPLFGKIAETFLKYYIEEFGTNHMYNADLFNEMLPPSNDTEYLADCAKSVYRTMIVADPKAKWLLQGWMFQSDSQFWSPERAKAFLTAVPIGRIIVLDLEAELNPQYQRLSSFYGQPFIWSIVQNYGGVSGLYGSLENINEGTFLGRSFPNSTMIGTGISPEGIETNDIIYELMNEMAWRKSPVQLDKWMRDYSARRYGYGSSDLRKAILLLQRSVYNATGSFKNHGKYILTIRPSLKLKPYVWYNTRNVFEAWKLYVNASQDTAVQNSSLFKHDLVDLSRQGIQLTMDGFYSSLLQSYLQNDIDLFKNVSSSIIELYSDLEELLNTDVHFLLGPWLKTAESWSINDLEKKQYEFNARNQITLWGPSGQILDYANKQWTGVITKYYLKRWKVIFEILERCIMNISHFNQAEYNNQVLNTVEIPFTLEDQDYPINPKGDAIKTSQKIFQKYMRQTPSALKEEAQIIDI